jgi:hypothetical protein
MSELIVGQLVRVRDHVPTYTHRVGTIIQVLPEHLYICVEGRSLCYKKEDVQELQEDGSGTNNG